MRKINPLYPQYQRGVTLIETIMYISLFSLIIGGPIVAAYQIFESSGRDHTRIILQEEGDFLVAKINWALSGAQTITGPSAATCNGSTGNTLLLTKWDLSIGTIAFSQTGDSMVIIRNAGTPEPLNNSNTTLSNLGFRHCYDGGDNPESVNAAFTLSARTPAGQIISQDFFTTVYVRK